MKSSTVINSLSDKPGSKGKEGGNHMGGECIARHFSDYAAMTKFIALGIKK